ncbi:hypothetical protein P3S68_024900 [Capsicum galapagoense]
MGLFRNTKTKRTKTMARRFSTFALKLKVHCKYCARELEKELLSIKGVRSVTIDQELGKVVISGKIDPAKLLRKFRKDGRDAEFWGEQEEPHKDTNALSEVTDPLNDPDIKAQLEKCSDNSSVKSVEVTKSVKVTYEGDSRNDPSEKIVEINNTTKNVEKPHDHYDHSHCGGGELCGASSSCCGGHSAISHNLNHGCCQCGNTNSLGPCCAHGRNSCYYHSQYGNNTSCGLCCAPIEETRVIITIVNMVILVMVLIMQIAFPHQPHLYQMTITGRHHPRRCQMIIIKHHHHHNPRGIIIRHHHPWEYFTHITAS